MASEEKQVTLFIDMQKADNKNMQNYYKNKKPPSLKYWNVNNLDGCAIYKKFLVNDLK